MSITVWHQLTNNAKFISKDADNALAGLITHLQMLEEAGFCLNQIRFAHSSVKMLDGSYVSALSVEASRKVTAELPPSTAATYQHEKA